MKPTQKIQPLFYFLLAFMILLAANGCSNGSSSGSDDTGDVIEIPPFTAAVFSDPTLIDNEYFPLVPGTVQLYLAETEDGDESTVVEVLEETKVVDGVTCAVVRDRVFLDELLIEDTYDWYAQDDDGNVWYMGEEVTNYEYDDEGDLVDIDDEGSWEAGVDDTVPGYLMKATLTVGETYRQEYYEDEAEDMAEIESIGVQVELEDGSVYEDCLQTFEWNPLEPDSEEYKYYAPGVGLIKEELIDGDEAAELKGVFITGEGRVPDFEAAVFTNPTVIDNTYLPLVPGTVLNYETETEDGVETITTEVLSEARMVWGVECVVFHDQVFLDDVLIEDTYDWFSQDDAGNVWYMGEDVVNYEYDEENNLIDTNDDGSWEAGVEGALPGIFMWAAPEVGASYYQEYYEGEAEDMGYIVMDGVEVELGDGTIFDDCLQVLDWNPLDPGVLEYKYYAPEVGLIKEEHLGGDEVVELVQGE